MFLICVKLIFLTIFIRLITKILEKYYKDSILIKYIMKTMNFLIEEELLKRFKAITKQKRDTMSRILIEFIKKYVKQHQKEID